MKMIEPKEILQNLEPGRVCIAEVQMIGVDPPTNVGGLLLLLLKSWMWHKDDAYLMPLSFIRKLLVSRVETEFILDTWMHFVFFNFRFFNFLF